MRRDKTIVPPNRVSLLLSDDCLSGRRRVNRRDSRSAAMVREARHRRARLVFRLRDRAVRWASSWVRSSRASPESKISASRSERASRSVSASCGGVHLERPAGDRAVGRYRESGWARGRLGQLWFLAVLACGVAAALGFLATDVSGTVQGDRAAASLREGSLLLTNSLMPFSFERGARLPARPRPLSSASRC
jgi:hypothetical protein